MFLLLLNHKRGEERGKKKNKDIRGCYYYPFFFLFVSYIIFKSRQQEFLVNTLASVSTISNLVFHSILGLRTRRERELKKSKSRNSLSNWSRYYYIAIS